MANGTRTTHIYDFDGRLTQLDEVKTNGILVDRLVYSYNNVGIRKGLQELTGEITTWTYDATYQLTGQQRGGAANLDWSTLTIDEWSAMPPEGWLTLELNPWEANYTLSDLYDCAGNRTLSTENGVATSYAYDGANQLQASSNGGRNCHRAFENRPVACISKTGQGDDCMVLWLTFFFKPQRLAFRWVVLQVMLWRLGFGPSSRCAFWPVLNPRRIQSPPRSYSATGSSCP